ncbi:bifunctional UDP-N-acetylglucosamine diphosphorylase/glucosamine-1-phosphate N-acetyltransferase GlmU [Proteocatella sphenisci]|uniref:bifunctional UDP-N-acetylglucosamine diphosphorylase/glucosamine-1-phosphate N-acetyltransferase GlmU n=1 Tax=Proteocatella sphenisci TaxID=181070 RepID=UPI00048D248F|nr:bifunctional UDP-N-acetylglucosamine diphosphorylase/glucosamine-1-phosphate N-acetyltransferase GlmU [Proteocatella sphenisci]
MSLKVIILAAGQGTRMKSELPKVMHKVCGLPMLEHVLNNTEIDNSEAVVVIGHKSEVVKDYFEQSVKYAYQTEQLGTGHAVMMAIDYIADDDEVLIVCGDTPLIEKEVLQNMYDLKKQGNKAVIMTSFVKDPTGYGRIVKSRDKFIKIVEEKDSDENQKKINEINAGTYIIEGKLLKSELANLSTNNSQNEYYLTDVLENIAIAHQVSTFVVDSESILGINSRLQLSQAEYVMRKRINEGHMKNGVTMINPDCTYIDKSVIIEKDCMIHPNCYIKGSSVIKKNTEIRENTTIENSIIGENVTVKSSTILDSKIGNNTTVGPYAYLRPGTKIGNNCKIGDFVEFKNASFGDGSKASHLSYVGDAEIGSNVNIGCGVVFVNYDGENKFKTVVKDNSFIGSNSNLVAPVTIEENAFIAAGSTITQDVPKGNLAIARGRQVNKNDWNNK